MSRAPHRRGVPSDSLALPLDESAGPLAILREAVRLLPRVPVALALFVGVALLTLVSTSLGNLLDPLVGAVGVTAAYEELGGEVDDGNSFGVRLLLVLVASLVAGVAILLGLVVLVLPGVYLILRLRLVTAAVMLEDSGPVAALGRSLELTRGRALTVFGVWLLPVLVGLSVGAVIVVATGGVTLAGEVNPAAVQSGIRLAEGVLALVVSPVVATADAVMYALYGPDDLDGSAGPDVGGVGRPPGR
jgi:hypothetical protein